MTQRALNGLYPLIELCHRGEERKRLRLVEEEARVGAATAISAYGIPLAPISSFKYIVRVLLAEYEDLAAVLHNLRRAQKKWARLTRVLGREGEDARTSGIFYVEVVQVVLLYGLKTWLMSPRIGRTLGGFHHRVSRRMTRRKPRRGLENGSAPGKIHGRR